MTGDSFGYHEADKEARLLKGEARHAAPQLAVHDTAPREHVIQPQTATVHRLRHLWGGSYSKSRLGHLLSTSTV